MSIEDEVRRMASLVPAPPDEDLPLGANEEAIRAFESRTGLSVPISLREWLQFTNGPGIGPGGLLGIGPNRSELDIEGVLQSYPTWREKGWIPIAGDGCGNYYLVSTSQGGGVYFIDASIDPERLDYVVASDVWRFLWFLLNRELGKKDWPFSREYVLLHDPEVERCLQAPLAWDA
jgi:hypothetical protein